MVVIRFLKRLLFLVFFLIFVFNIQFFFKNENVNSDQKNISTNYIVSNINFNDNGIKNEDIIWRLTIPSIELDAEICDGVDDDVLNKWIGHFEETGYSSGNIVLAAHNRGYPVNYFENLKSLKIGDEINYYYHGISLKYCVSEVNIIKDTQVEILENTNENIITLITCVENEPEYRRCIIGKEIK